ncbi:hypothetical protein QTP70_020332 [Hemibagrus guttatus]|uniref:Uncharacterized protein n=1 Tax=Hemibagrus guttatus TaxID=175788 RepID=A0AAE0RBL8_9TELE|nr:hypothetical protein QTP70_020332 [Hemibagrus guttatus]
MTLLPGSVALKAINTTIVFPRTQEIQRTKVIPNVVCRSIQDHSEGRPMKSKQQMGFPFCTAFLVPGGQLSLQMDFGTFDKERAFNDIKT